MSLPGFTWRILAHHRTTSGYEGRALDLRFKPSDRVEFDELVIGEWFHMEQMSDRSWYIRLGDDRLIYVRVPVRGKPVVEVVDE